MAASSQYVYTLQFTSLERLAQGCNASIYGIPGTSMVVKLDDSQTTELHEIERKTYERLGLHPRIAHYYGETLIEISPGRKQFGLVLKYYGLGTLRELLNDPGSPGRMLLRTGRKWEWTAQIIDSMQYLHSKGVIHGDAGIHNILVGNDLNLVFTDFGGSSIDGSMCLAGPSARYIRPGLELDGARCQVTRQDDIFALGTILYEVSTGRELHKDKSRSDIMQSFQNRIFPDLAAIPSQGVRSIIQNCWDQHYDHIGQVQNDFRLKTEFSEYRE